MRGVQSSFPTQLPPANVYPVPGFVLRGLQSFMLSSERHRAQRGSVAPPEEVDSWLATLLLGPG